MKNAIPWLIASATGFLIVVAYFIPAAQDWQGKVLEWFEILAAFAFVLGGTNLFAQHLQKITARRAGWGYSAVTVIAFLVTFVAGVLKLGAPAPARHPGNAWAASYTAEGSVLWWIFKYLFTPLSATVFALLAFYIASAAFRAFRVKHVEAAILLVTALVVLLGRTYAGAWLTSAVPEEYSALTFPGLTALILAVGNTAGQRAIMIGIALGVAATSLKVLLGIDRSYLGSDGE
jgi:hypothetical protein